MCTKIEKRRPHIEQFGILNRRHVPVKGMIESRESLEVIIKWIFPNMGKMREEDLHKSGNHRKRNDDVLFECCDIQKAHLMVLILLFIAGFWHQLCSSYSIISSCVTNEPKKISKGCLAIIILVSYWFQPSSRLLYTFSKRYLLSLSCQNLILPLDRKGSKNKSCVFAREINDFWSTVLEGHDSWPLGDN